MSARVLIIEDYEPVAELERRSLARAGMEAVIAHRLKDALALLRREAFSAILLDYQLPDGNPWSVVEMAHARTPRIPVAIVTAMGTERIAAEAIQRGVAEYVRKSGTFYDELPDVVARVVKLAEAEERLRRSDALLHLVRLHARELIATLDASGRFTSASGAARRLLGREPEALAGVREADLVHPDDRAHGLAARLADAASRSGATTVRWRREDGSWARVEASYEVTRDSATGAPVELIAVARELSAPGPGS